MTDEPSAASVAFARMRATLDTDVRSAARHVLLLLALRADREGQCTPGIARIASDTRLSVRNVQRAIAELVASKDLTRDELPGCGVVYTVHPRQAVTPDTESPPSGKTPTPVSLTPKQPRTTIVKKTTSSPLPDLPAGTASEAWQSFHLMRCEMARTGKSPRPWTAGAMAAARRELGKLAAAGNDPTAVLERSTLMGWQGLFPLPTDRAGRDEFPTIAAAQRALAMIPPDER